MKKKFLVMLSLITILAITVITTHSISATTLEQSQMKILQGSCPCLWPQWCDGCNYFFASEQYKHSNVHDDFINCIQGISEAYPSDCGEPDAWKECGTVFYFCGLDYRCDDCDPESGIWYFPTHGTGDDCVSP